MFGAGAIVDVLVLFRGTTFDALMRYEWPKRRSLALGPSAQRHLANQLSVHELHVKDIARVNTICPPQWWATSRTPPGAMSGLFTSKSSQVPLHSLHVK